MLELNGIRKSFGKIEVLRGVDLEARAGEVHALLGENGAGKSTLMKILSGILQPSEGTIRIDGMDRRFANYDEAIAAGVGIVFQEFSLIPYLNAVENMFLAREIRARCASAQPKSWAGSPWMYRSTCRCTAFPSPSSNLSKSPRPCHWMPAFSCSTSRPPR